MEIDSAQNVKNLRVVQKLAALRPVFEIYDDDTQVHLATIRQTWLSVLRSTMHMEDPSGNRIMTVKGGFFDFTFKLFDETGLIAVMKRPLLALRQSFTIHYRDEVIKAQGGVLAIGFDAVNSQGEYVFRVDKKILALRDQYRISIVSDIDWRHAAVLAVVIDRSFYKSKGCGACLCGCLFILVILLALILFMLSLRP